MTHPLPLSRLGNYELVRLLAQGGMADIYLAKQDDRHVAVKVLSSERARDAESCAMFLDEARLVGMLDHANLASVYEVDTNDGVHYLAMEYVQGADLREIVGRARDRDVAIPYDTALTIVAAAAAGLDHAHRLCGADGRPLHLVHRDVSLSNIMVDHAGGVKVIDFGIAVSTASIHVTNPGIVRGKASYMAPEQCLGDPVDLRADVFALGIVLYELTTGRRCFHGNSDFERMVAVVRGEWVPPSLHTSEFPASLEQVIKTALALDPAHRYPSAAALIEALEAVAVLEGWTLGAAATAQLMSDLFGAPACPWVHDQEDATFICPPPSPSPVTTWPGVAVALPPMKEPTVVITKPRRIARGTESDVYERVDEPSDWRDEAPTRGRRSMPRPWCARVAA